MKHKLNKQKGFTLIELMVVIAIIALLSSVVLASLKGAREKAVLSKTVAEMKSLQNAIELYRNQFGRYPGVNTNYNYDDDVNGLILYGLFAGTLGFEDFIKTELVDKKLLAKVPYSPDYPNNCVDYNQCYNRGYILGYSAFDAYWYVDYPLITSNIEYPACGGQKIKNYVIYFYANNKKINLPILSYYYSGVFNNFYTGSSDLSQPPYIYCLAM